MQAVKSVSVTVLWGIVSPLCSFDSPVKYMPIQTLHGSSGSLHVKAAKTGMYGDMDFGEAGFDEFVLYLPGTVQELVRLLGFDETQLLLEEYGGARRYVPKKANRRPLSWSKVSEASFKALCASFAGETLELPKFDSLQRAERDLEIILLTMNGVSRNQLVERYGLTYRQIGNIRKRYRAVTDDLNETQVNALHAAMGCK